MGFYQKCSAVLKSKSNAIDDPNVSGNTTYRPDIDGLRAIAVLSVVLFHAGYSFVSGGYVGVDVFFVISGYLITGSLLNETAQNRFSIQKFYVRRALRILPLLFVVLGTSAVAAWFILQPKEMKDFASSLMYAAIFISNSYFYSFSTYFDEANELRPLLHTWSLSIEEQFYIFYPLFGALLYRFKTMFRVCLVLIGLWSLYLAEINVRAEATSAYFLLSSRIWELALGALLCFVNFNFIKSARQKIGADFLGMIGLLLIAYSVFIFDTSTEYPSLKTLIPALGTSLVIVFGKHSKLVKESLGWRPMVLVGLCSYSIYLWHQPVFAFLKIINGPHLDTWCTILSIVFIFCISFLSWKFVEKPTRYMKIKNEKVLIYSLLLSASFFFFGKAGVETNGFDYRIPSQLYALINYAQNSMSFSGACVVNARGDNTCKDFDAAGKKIAVTLGDSHAVALTAGLNPTIAQFKNFTFTGCPPIGGIPAGDTPECRSARKHIFAKIESLKPEIVLLHANWSFYVSPRFQESIQELLRNLQNFTTRVIVVGSIPQWYPSLPSVLISHNANPFELTYLKNPNLDELKVIDKELSRACETTGVDFVSAIENLCRGDSCVVTIGQQGTTELLIWDYGHLTESGAKWLSERILTPLFSKN